MWSVCIPLCLAALSVLPTCSSTQYQSDFKCTGKLNNEDARKKVLDSHNNYRRMVAAGNVTNKRGYIPEAGDMIELIYACDLEEKAQDLIDGCPTKDKFSYSGAYNFLGATVGTTPEDATTKWYTEYKDGNVRWPRKNILIKTQVNNAQFVSLANMINANTSAVGCAYQNCTYPTNQNGAIILCLYDSPALAVGTQLYKSGEACLYCPTTCNDQLCVRQPDTTTPPTTTSPTTTAPTTAPTPAPTSAPTPATTAVGGGSTGCSPDQSQDVRNRALDMINYRRSELAKGAVAKNNGALLPSAANMRKITYDCALEVEAMAYAQQCTTAGSNQLGITENFERVSAADQFKAISVATRSWWKQVRLQPGIGVKMVTFRDKHMSSPIRFFTLMGWADVQRMGCGVYNCGNLFNVICRYDPRGNIINNVVYVKGSPASQCPSGTRPDSTYPTLCA